MHDKQPSTTLTTTFYGSEPFVVYFLITIGYYRIYYLQQNNKWSVTLMGGILHLVHLSQSPPCCTKCSSPPTKGQFIELMFFDIVLYLKQGFNYKFTCLLTYCVARWCNGKAFGLAISRSRVQILLEATLRNNLMQVVYTYVPLSPSSITWYRPKGGDALRLGR